MKKIAILALLILAMSVILIPSLSLAEDTSDRGTSYGSRGRTGTGSRDTTTTTTTTTTATSGRVSDAVGGKASYLEDVTGSDLRQSVNEVKITNFTWPVDGQNCVADVKLEDKFPGKITRKTFTINKKSTDDLSVTSGDNLEFYVIVELNEGYKWADTKNAYLEGEVQTQRIKTEDMSERECGFLWKHVVGLTDKIKIEDQSPEIVMYISGEDVKLFVKATGATKYEWRQYKEIGAAKKVIRAVIIDGATNSEYIIKKADSSLDGEKFVCYLYGENGERLISKDIKLTLIMKKIEDTKASGDNIIPAGPNAEEIKTSGETKSGDVKTSGDTKNEEVNKPTDTKTEEPVETQIWSKASDWALEELKKADKENLIPWIFEKEDLTVNITRREFAYVAVKLYEKITNIKLVESKENPFTDTEDIEVLKAYNIGITLGTSSTTFTPDALITREQMATMMTRALSKAGIDTSVDLNKVTKFADDSLMHDWGRASIYYMSNIEIIKGVGDNLFSVSGNATREQALLISVRSAEKFAK